jgi:hypothetical protein
MATKNAKKLSFYNVKTKKKFVPTEYTVKVRGKRRFGVAKNSGIDCWRVLGKSD